MNATRICPECQEEVAGRKNKIYCSPECKINYNNRKAYELRSEMIDLSVMNKTFKILKSLYKSSEGDNIYKVDDIIKLGIQFQVPYRRIKSPRYGYEFMVIHSYGFRFLKRNEKQFIHIVRKDEINKF